MKITYSVNGLGHNFFGAVSSSFHIKINQKVLEQLSRASALPNGAAARDQDMHSFTGEGQEKRVPGKGG